MNERQKDSEAEKQAREERRSFFKTLLRLLAMRESKENEKQKTDHLCHKVACNQSVGLFAALPCNHDVLICPECKGAYVCQDPDRMKGEKGIYAAGHVDRLDSNPKLNQFPAVIRDKIIDSGQRQRKNGIVRNDLSYGTPKQSIRLFSIK